MAERAPLADLRGGTAPLAARPAPRQDLEPGAALRSGAGPRPRAARRRRRPVRALPAYARLGHPLCRRAARPAVVRLGARQGHLDHAGLGEGREAAGLRLGDHLHRNRRRAAARAGAGRRGDAHLSRSRREPLCRAAARTGARRQRSRPPGAPAGRRPPRAEEGGRGAAPRARGAAARGALALRPHRRRALARGIGCRRRNGLVSPSASHGTAPCRRRR